MKSRKRLIAALAAVFALNIAIITLAQSGGAQAAAYRVGSTGSTVSEIQTRLKNWGYYSGSVDGIYGGGTEKAVRWFQSNSGITVDGVVGAKTLEKLGISGGATSTSNDIELLARIISAEARGEPYEGQVAVGAVIMNRIDHPSFPNTLSGVVYQERAFTAVDDGQINLPATESCRRAAQEALNGSDPTGGAIYYYNPVTATSQWIFSRPIITTIGKHVFCS